MDIKKVYAVRTEYGRLNIAFKKSLPNNTYWEGFYFYFFPDILEIMNITIPTITATNNKPAQKPALKIPSIALQLLNSIAAINNANAGVNFFMFSVLYK